MPGLEKERNLRWNLRFVSQHLSSVRVSVIRCGVCVGWVGWVMGGVWERECGVWGVCGVWCIWCVVCVVCELCGVCSMCGVWGV